MKQIKSTQKVSIFSSHAKTRMQQRSIPEAAVDLILDFADGSPVGSRCLRYRFTAKTWANARAYLGNRATAFEKFRNAYVIESSDGTVVTAAWLN